MLHRYCQKGSSCPLQPPLHTLQPHHHCQVPGCDFIYYEQTSDWFYEESNTILHIHCDHPGCAITDTIHVHCDIDGCHDSLAHSHCSLCNNLHVPYTEYHVHCNRANWHKNRPSLALS